MARITWHNENPQLTHALPLETYTVPQLQRAKQDAAAVTTDGSTLYAVVYDTTHGDRYYFHAGRQYAAHFNA